MADEVPEYEAIGPYKVLKVLGSGSFAQVSVAQHKDTGEKVALKVINTATWNSKNKARRSVLLKREIRLCKLLHHPNIIKMIGTMQDGPKVILIMEHMSGGDLESYTYAQKHRYVPERKAAFFFRQIVSGIDYLHKNSITHRDIKPANIILDAKQQIPKLIDFGFTNIFDENEKMQSFLGSPHFAAPELLTGTKYSGPAVDIWSLAVTIYACLTGQLPFQANNMEKLMELIVHSEFEYPPHITQPARDLIDRMLTVDMNARCTMEEVRTNAWVNQGHKSPPVDLAIPRDEPVTSVDNAVFSALSAFGYEDHDANAQALQAEGPNTIKNIYCLILEARARERLGRPVAPPTASDTSPAPTPASTQKQPEQRNEPEQAPPQAQSATARDSTHAHGDRGAHVQSETSPQETESHHDKVHSGGGMHEGAGANPNAGNAHAQPMGSPNDSGHDAKDDKKKKKTAFQKIFGKRNKV